MRYPENLAAIYRLMHDMFAWHIDRLPVGHPRTRFSTLTSYAIRMPYSSADQVFLALENESSDTDIDIDIDEYGKRASSFMSDDSYISEDFGCFSDFSDD